MEKQLEMLSNVPGINRLSQVVAQDFNVAIKLPDNVKCTGGTHLPQHDYTKRLANMGASLRLGGQHLHSSLRNNAIAGPFGGCFPIQQIDVEPTINTPQNIKSFKGLPGVLSQIDGNLRDLDEAIKALAREGSAEAKNNLEAGHALLKASAISKRFPTTTQLAPTNAVAGPTSAGGGANASTTPAASLTSAAATSRRRKGKRVTLTRKRMRPTSSASATTTAPSGGAASTTAAATSALAASTTGTALSSSLVLKPFRA
ncbi:hypothetical protein GGTG_04583 [Gaeumannomyces tritici R3-111a-1]|uniref:Uncharacterized protein n=1 Tax=Gaeumannomyces tritici (strain R3-111a-1) TaxID=644352 RepID=J3NTI3_GAET3|nr:hypothetical protein GGTG_04583 [Gaeumannomyces tritici R3-111a-1]EJT79499.1 hypothetical protein GGTG_04583 [Gaeumannomyces tritici R3-111a-1]